MGTPAGESTLEQKEHDSRELCHFKFARPFDSRQHTHLEINGSLIGLVYNYLSIKYAVV